MKVEHFE